MRLIDLKSLYFHKALIENRLQLKSSTRRAWTKRTWSRSIEKYRSWRCWVIRTSSSSIRYLFNLLAYLPVLHLLTSSVSKMVAGASIHPKSMMHIAYSPYFHWFYEIHTISKKFNVPLFAFNLHFFGLIYVFCLILFLASHSLTMMHLWIMLYT